MRAPNKKDTRADKLALFVKRASMAAGFYRLITAGLFAAMLLALAWFFRRMQIPWQASAAMVLIAPAIVLIEIISLKRISDTEMDGGSPGAEESAVALDPDEVLAGTVPAVMRYGKLRSIEILGAGKVLTPENALLVTNRAVWALTVPLSGADKVVSGADIGKWQWMYAYQDIVGMLERLTATLPLDAVLVQCRAKRLMELGELQSAKAHPMSRAISFACRGKGKFSYSVRTERDYLTAKELFNIH